MAPGVIEFGDSLTDDSLKQEVADKLGMTVTEIRALRDLLALLPPAAHEEFKRQLVELTQEVACEYSQRR